MSVARRGTRLALFPSQFEELRAELGVTPPISGLAPTEVKVLAALRLAPLGLASVRSVASRAAVSPTAASRALGSLEKQDLAYRDSAVIALGRARLVELWQANLLHPRWGELAESLDRVVPPKRPEREARSDRVPPRLRHLFWNVSHSQLDARRAGPFIARRLLRTEDPEGLAWGSTHLKPEDWDEGVRARDLDERVRALAENLARSGSQ
jgi:DNA-binding MarR family transcriptional regulator